MQIRGEGYVFTCPKSKHFSISVSHSIMTAGHPATAKIDAVLPQASKVSRYYFDPNQRCAYRSSSQGVWDLVRICSLHSLVRQEERFKTKVLVLTLSHLITGRVCRIQGPKFDAELLQRHGHPNDVLKL